MLVVVTSVGLAGGVSAHHSFAMFDKSRTVTLKGAVRKVEYKNPHVFLFVEVPDSASVVPDSAHAKLYAVECASINFLLEVGWKVNTIKAGDSVTVTMHPLRDGSPGGQVNTVTLANGRVIKANP